MEVLHFQPCWISIWLSPVVKQQVNNNNFQLTGQMGATAPHEQIFNWSQTEPHRYVNRSTGEQIDHQRVPLTSQHALDMYRNRLKLARSNVVRLVYFARAPGSGGLCEEGKDQVDVYIEGGLTRLDALAYGSNRGQSGLYGRECVCQDIMKGFESLREFYGPFQAQSGMVWLDRQGKAKVWTNRNPFLNEYVTVKQNLMVLQIKQLLLKLECKCNVFSQPDLSFNNFKIKFQRAQLNKTGEIGKMVVSQGNQVKKHIGVSKSPGNVGYPFYYPPNLPMQPKYASYNPKPQGHGFSAIPKQKYSQNLSKTQKIEIKKQPEQPRTAGGSNPDYHTIQQRKNHSTIISLNTKCSTPKVMFNYECQSNRGTPTKMFRHQPVLQSEVSSPVGVTHLRFDDRSGKGEDRKSGKPMGFYHQPYIFRPERTHNQPNASYLDHRPSLNSQKSLDIRTPPFQLVSQQQKLIKISSAPDKHMNYALEQAHEGQNSSELSLDRIRRQMIYQNSYTDRQTNNYEGSKMRASVESEKVEATYQELEYQIPEKTKLLIEKYLVDDSKVKKVKEGQKSRAIGNTSFENRDYFMRGRQKIYKISRQSIEDGNSSALLDRRVREDSDQQKDSEEPEIKRVVSEKTGGSMERSQRQLLKKQMEKIFNFVPPDEEENKIRKKVAQKKAFFADLKKEASKILDDKEE